MLYNYVSNNHKLSQLLFVKKRKKEFEMKNIAVIFAGGVGSRMGSNIPKQFLEIYGKPILIHTLEKFQYHNQIDEIYIGCKEEYIPYLKELAKKYNITKLKDNFISKGGKTGLDTIYSILKNIKKNNEEAIVLIHDGVRPNIPDELITKNIQSVEEYGTAITCVSAYETPILSDDNKYIDKVIDRNKVYMAKAPQSFKLTKILNAYDNLLEEYKTLNIPGIVDSCSVALNNNIKLKMIEGNRDNIKVTTPNDYIDILSRMISTDYRHFFEVETRKRQSDE